MVERLRILLERPLDPAVAGAVLVLACAVLLGFAAVVVLVGTAAERSAPPPPRPAAERPAAAARPTVVPTREPRPNLSPDRSQPRQDPQDRPGSAAARRAGRELANHRALQYVPYRHGGLSVALIGARGARAVLQVRAATLAAARRGWQSFLRRYHDAGRAYLPIFEARRGHRG